MDKHSEDFHLLYSLLTCTFSTLRFLTILLGNTNTTKKLRIPVIFTGIWSSLVLGMASEDGIDWQKSVPLDAPSAAYLCGVISGVTICILLLIEWCCCCTSNGDGGGGNGSSGGNGMGVKMSPLNHIKSILSPSDERKESSYTVVGNGNGYHDDQFSLGGEEDDDDNTNDMSYEDDMEMINNIRMGYKDKEANADPIILDI